MSRFKRMRIEIIFTNIVECRYLEFPSFESFDFAKKVMFALWKFNVYIFHVHMSKQFSEKLLLPQFLVLLHTE